MPRQTRHRLTCFTTTPPRLWQTKTLGLSGYPIKQSARLQDKLVVINYTALLIFSFNSKSSAAPLTPAVLGVLSE